MAPGFSIFALLTLVTIEVASVWVYLVLVERSTTQRRTIALTDWASDRRLQFHSEREMLRRPPELPAVVMQLLQSDAVPGIVFTSARAGGPNAGVTILQMHPIRVTEAGTKFPAPIRWNLLIRPLTQKWPITALRPAAGAWSIVDFLRLTVFASPLSTARFVAVGESAATARLLAAGPVKSQLPPDCGMVLHGSYLVVDFSGRAFDPLELSRVLEISDVLLGSLPQLP